MILFRSIPGVGERPRGTIGAGAACDLRLIGDCDGLVSPSSATGCRIVMHCLPFEPRASPFLASMALSTVSGVLIAM